MPNLPLSYEEMRGAIVSYLAEFPGGQFNDLSLQLASYIHKRMGIPQPVAETHMYGPPMLSPHDYGRACTIMWDLMIEGIIRPGLNDGNNLNLPFFHVTERGKAMLKDPNTPYDPDGFLRKIRTAIPDIDVIIMAYLAESLHTFRINCLLSSTIALGVAAEKTLLLAIEAYGDALPSPRKEAFKKKTDGMMIKVQYDHFSKFFESHLKALLPNDVKESLDIALVTVFNMFRTHRNGAGHPTGKTLSREEVHALLTSFPLYVTKVYAMISWIKTNAPLP